MRFFFLNAMPWIAAGLVGLGIILYALYKLLPEVMENRQENKERKLREKIRQEAIDRRKEELFQYREKAEPIISWLIINKESVRGLPANLEERLYEVNQL